MRAIELADDELANTLRLLLQLLDKRGILTITDRWGHPLRVNLGESNQDIAPKDIHSNMVPMVQRASEMRVCTPRTGSVLDMMEKTRHAESWVNKVMKSKSDCSENILWVRSHNFCIYALLIMRLVDSRNHWTLSHGTRSILAISVAVYKIHAVYKYLNDTCPRNPYATLACHCSFLGLRLFALRLFCYLLLTMHTLLQQVL